MICKILKTRCQSCIFSKNTPIGPERMRELAAAWSEHGHQICHQFGYSEEDAIVGEDVWCRGFFETQIPDQQQRIFHQLAEFGIIEFVDLPDTDLV